jgi:hypothetical protein
MDSQIKKWIKKGRSVETFSYVDVKEFNENQDNPNQICNKDINWFHAPHGIKVKSFIAKPYDILITINPEKKKHLHFLNATSKARFKIGILPDYVEFYNLIIDCKNPSSITNIFTDIQTTLDKLTI